jgi:hypothetical protein
MTEQELRALVRQAIAHHLPGGSPESRAIPARPSAVEAPASFHRQHISHGMFTLPAEPGGPCVIEPAVTCNHCGFCKSYGH